MRNFLILTTLLLSSLAHASRINEVRKLLESSVYACPDRIWKGVDWRAARITLVSPSTGTGMTLQHGQVEVLNEEASKGFTSGYKIENRGVIVNVDYAQSAQDAFALLVHEGFHAFGQYDFQQSTEGRTEIYPAKYEPRLEREELTRALISHFRGEAGGLERAAAWHRRHASHKEPLGSDVIEGSAEYVEKVATVIAKLGCEVSEKVLVDQVVESIAEQGGAFDKEYEHYRIGALGFLLARPEMQKILSQVEDDLLPLDVLFKQVKAADDISADSLLDHAAEMTVSMANRQSEDVMNPIKEHIAAGKTLVFVPYKGLRGSFVHRGSFKSDETTYFQNLELETSAGKIEGHGFSAKACGDQQGFMVVTEQEIGSTQLSEKHLSSNVTCL